MNPHSRNLGFILDPDQDLSHSHTNPKIMTNNVKRKSGGIPSPRTTRFALCPLQLEPAFATARSRHGNRKEKEGERGRGAHKRKGESSPPLLSLPFREVCFNHARKHRLGGGSGRKQQANARASKRTSGRIHPSRRRPFLLLSFFFRLALSALRAAIDRRGGKGGGGDGRPLSNRTWRLSSAKKKTGEEERGGFQFTKCSRFCL